ncbi:MAG TPA: fibronectin type III domain-containing protein [Verrucomicrobiae bacterium]|nr:fibronectin type III domain-containing protein [Verrucomicrobiae bacterium]
MLYPSPVVWTRLAVLALFFITFSAAAQNGQSFTLAWNPSPDPTVAGYVVYYGTSSGNYTTRMDVGTNTTATITNLQPGVTYYFAVTDYNSDGVESAPSGEISLLVPGIVKLRPNGFPGGIMLILFPVLPSHWYEVQASTDLKTWATIGQTSVATSNVWMGCADFEGSNLQHRFYRVRTH